jgi:hypothetical protein
MAFLQSFVSRLQQETQNLLPQVHEGSVSDPSASSGNSTDLPASPEVKEACDACQSIFLGESVHRALRKETGLHNVDLTFPNLDLRNFMDNLLVQFITFQRSRSSLVSGSWAGCTMCSWLLTLYLRSYIPGTTHSDSLAGIMSLTDQPAFRVQWDLGFTVTRNEHFDSVVNIAVLNCPEKFLMLEVAAEGERFHCHCDVIYDRLTLFQSSTNNPNRAGPKALPRTTSPSGRWLRSITHSCPKLDRQMRVLPCQLSESRSPVPT